MADAKTTTTTTTLFNGATNYHGFIESWSGGEATITVARATGNSDQAIQNAIKTALNSESDDNKVTEGFYVQQYQLGFQRTVQNQYFMNIKGAVAILGRGQGTLSLSGLVGKADQFLKLFGANKDGSSGQSADGSFARDFCNPLVIVIKGGTQLKSCGSQGAVSANGLGVTFICSNVIINNFSVQGQLQADGAEMQVAGIQAQFTALDVKTAAQASN